MIKKKYVVLGAGPTGLMAAWRLIKEGHQVTLLEKGDAVGGFGASFKRDGFILDYGPHTIHVKKGEVLPVVKSYLGDDLVMNKRNIRTLAKGKIFKYPFEFYNLMTQLNPFLGIRMIFDFLMVSFMYQFIHVPEGNFESWGIRRFGRTLYDFCFGHYTQKVWGMPSHLISSKFAAQKIKGLSIKNIISKLLGGKGEEQELYWEDLIYSTKGSGLLFTRMAGDLTKKGVDLHLNAPVSQIHYEENKVKSVRYMKNQKEYTLEVDYVVSSIPIRNLILMIRPAFGDYISYTAKRLKFRGMIFVYLVLNTERMSDAHWLYLLDERFKFNRVTEQKNLSEQCCPKDKTVLCFEMCAGNTEPVWNYTDDQLKELVLKEIQHIKIIDPKLISDCFVVKKDEAYAVCHLNYDQHLKDLFEHLSNIKNLLSTGRQGLYQQIDMHDSMALGMSASEFFLNDRQDALNWYKEKTAFLEWDR